METLEKYFELLKRGGADLAMRIEAQSVKTAPWTVYRCQYGPMDRLSLSIRMQSLRAKPLLSAENPFLEGNPGDD